jgi:hypothetical protein
MNFQNEMSKRVSKTNTTSAEGKRCLYHEWLVIVLFSLYGNYMMMKCILFIYMLFQQPHKPSYDF